MPIQAVLEHQRTLIRIMLGKPYSNKGLDWSYVNYSRKTKISEGAIRFLCGAADTKRTVAINEKA